jgi:hypothetical protein
MTENLTSDFRAEANRRLAEAPCYAAQGETPVWRSHCHPSKKLGRTEPNPFNGHEIPRQWPASEVKAPGAEMVARHNSVLDRTVGKMKDANAVDKTT